MEGTLGEENQIPRNIYISPSPRRVRSQRHQERRSRPRRRQSRQLDLRTGERQRQEAEDREDHFLVDSRRCRAQARTQGAGTGSACQRTGAGIRRGPVLTENRIRPRHRAGAFSVFASVITRPKLNLRCRRRVPRGLGRPCLESRIL